MQLVNPKAAILCLVYCFGLFSTTSVWSKNIPLTISGKSSSGDNLSISLERSQLEQLPQSSFSTELPWLEQSATFQGVRLLTLLEHYNVAASKLKLLALNDYSVEISHEYIEQYNPLVAIMQDGHYLKVRDYGPYWVVISLNEHPEAAETKHLANMVWQLTAIQAR